jgi:hypothetical protein
VLNSNANVTEANGVIPSQDRNFAIPTVAAAAGRQGEFLLQKCSGRCVHNHLVTPYDDTKRTTLYLVFAQKEYCLISLVILMYGLPI